MKIISWNVNGLKSVYEKGFSAWASSTNADIICLQEIKTNPEKNPADLFGSRPFELEGYLPCFNYAEKKGYSGVAIYAKKKPEAVKTFLGLERFDREGRILELEYRNFTLFNLYIPHGGREKENIGYKLEVYDRLRQYIAGFKNKNLIMVGDFNVARTELDLARPKDNKNNTMFTEEERGRLEELLRVGLIDTFREFHKEGGWYSWWPYRLDARERNLGWRIDYVFIPKFLLPQLKDAFILNRTEGSDHCPVGIDIIL